MYGYPSPRKAVEGTHLHEVGLGASRNYLSQENVDSYNRWYFRPQVTLTYTINEVLSARYRYNLRNVNPSLSELSNVEQWIDSFKRLVDPQARFSSRQDYHPCGKGRYLLHDLLVRHHYALLVAGVAEATSQVATGEADEYGGSPRMEPFALQAVEYLVNLPDF